MFVVPFFCPLTVFMLFFSFRSVCHRFFILFFLSVCHSFLCFGLSFVSWFLSFSLFVFLVPECVAKVGVEGVFAWRCLTVRNRPQPFAWGPYGRAYGKFCKRVTFGYFQRRVAAFRVAGVALRDIQTCFVTCRKLFCVACAILLRRFRKMSCSFRGRRRTLETFVVMSRGRRSTSDVLCVAGSTL
jgi:hypothetical protein